MKFISVFIILCITSVVNAETKLPPLHHVVRVDVPDTMTIPQKFPLNKKGQIDCSTCHGIKDIEETPIDEVDKNADDFFRQGPYPRLTVFCYQCHDKKQYQRNNIHKLLDEYGEIKEEQCKFCHVDPPDPEKEYKREDLKFRLSPQKLCLGCHLKSPHLNAVNHLVEVDDDMLQRIKDAELEHQVHLPMDEKLILCITCHSTHEKGVIDNTKTAAKQVQDRDLKQGVGYVEHTWNEVVKADKKLRMEELIKETGKHFEISYQRLKFEVLLRLPAKDGTLCLACHKFDL